MLIKKYFLKNYVDFYKVGSSLLTWPIIF